MTNKLKPVSPKEISLDHVIKKLSDTKQFFPGNLVKFSQTIPWLCFIDERGYQIHKIQYSNYYLITSKPYIMWRYPNNGNSNFGAYFLCVKLFNPITEKPDVCCIWYSAAISTVASDGLNFEKDFSEEMLNAFEFAVVD